MSSCNGNCSSCGSTSCGDRKAESLLATLNPQSTVKKVIAVVSGKGGVGMSLLIFIYCVYQVVINVTATGYITLSSPNRNTDFLENPLVAFDIIGVFTMLDNPNCMFVK